MAPIPPTAVSSAYIRKADARIPGTPASETVIPNCLKEKTTKDAGAAPAEGVTRTEPASVEASAPAVTSLNELCLGMLYVKIGAANPFAVTVTGAPAVVAVPWLKNCIVPVMVESVGLTSIIWVVQPPPSAKCGKNAVPLAGAADKLVIGSVVIRKSDGMRSLNNPRSAMTDTATSDVKLNVP